MFDKIDPKFLELLKNINIYLAPNKIPFGAKSNGKKLLQFKFNLTRFKIKFTVFISYEWYVRCTYYLFEIKTENLFFYAIGLKPVGLFR